MSQSDANLEVLLRTARQILTQEYVSIRAETHRQWIVNSERHWRTNQGLLPYPTIGLYPPESEIVAKALALYNLSNGTPLPQHVSLPIQTDQPPSVTAQLEQAYYGKATVTSTVIPSEPIIIDESILVVPLLEPEILEVVEVEPEIIEPASEVESLTESSGVPDEANEGKHKLLRTALSNWLKKS